MTVVPILMSAAPFNALIQRKAAEIVSQVLSKINLAEDDLHDQTSFQPPGAGA
jgi:hypothetical protein